MKKFRKYKQGIYNPTNSQKYKGSLPVIYRSKLELNMMSWLDRNDKVVSWGSESVVIPYTSPKDGKMHRYFVDFNFRMKRGDGVKKYLVEVKPSKQCKPPRPKKNQKTFIYESKMYAVNSAKFEAAKAWCSKNGYEFLIFTEKHLNSK